MLMMSRPSAITCVDDDDDYEEEPKPERPLIYKPAEPVWHPKYDDWGFPLPSFPEKKVEKENDE